MYIFSVILTYKKQRATGYILMYIEQLVNGFSAWYSKSFIRRDPAPRSNSLPFSTYHFWQKRYPFHIFKIFPSLLSIGYLPGTRGYVISSPGAALRAQPEGRLWMDSLRCSRPTHLSKPFVWSEGLERLPHRQWMDKYHIPRRDR